MRYFMFAVPFISSILAHPLWNNGMISSGLTKDIDTTLFGIGGENQ